METSLKPIERFAASLLVWLARAWSLLPVSLVRHFGVAAGRVVDLFPNRERAVADANIAACFPGLDPVERGDFRKRILRESGALFAEMPAAWFRSLRYWEARVEATGFEAHVESLLAQGRGLIVAAPHLGNWEIARVMLNRVIPVTAMYRPPRQPVLEPLLMRGRERDGARLVPATARGVRNVHAVLRRGGCIGILPDQAPKMSDGKAAGVFAPFFGLPAYTMTLVPRLAHRSGAPVLFMFAERQAKGRFRLRWLDAPPGIDAEDPVVAATALNAGVEACVRLSPDQYLWTYKRFAPVPRGTPSLYMRKRKARR